VAQCRLADTEVEEHAVFTFRAEDEDGVRTQNNNFVIFMLLSFRID
jgi:hypothetical protein